MSHKDWMTSLKIKMTRELATKIWQNDVTFVETLCNRYDIFPPVWRRPYQESIGQWNARNIQAILDNMMHTGTIVTQYNFSCEYKVFLEDMTAMIACFYDGKLCESELLSYDKLYDTLHRKIKQHEK